MPKRLAALLSSLLLPLAIAAFLIVSDREQTTPAAVTESVQGAMCDTPGFCEPKATTTTLEKKVEANATVLRTVDGDTFVAALDGEPGEWKVRMLGIDTPETVDPRKPVQCFGKEASKKLSELLSGKRVRLEADPQADERDKYDRLLRNVFLEDGMDVNALMVRDGYAYAYLSFPLNRERKSELKTLQELARASESGLWSKAACPVHS